MNDYTKNGKIRHIKNLLAKNAKEANDRYISELNSCSYMDVNYHKGKRDGYELAVILLKDLLRGLTYDPEEEE